MVEFGLLVPYDSPAKSAADLKGKAFGIATQGSITQCASGALQKSHVLVDFQHDIQIPYNGLATSTDLIAKNPDLVQRFTEAVLKGARYLKANRAGTLKVLQK